MKKVLLSLVGAVPVMLFAFSAGPPVKRTGAAVDGGINCTACHSTYGPANSDARGSVVISAANYVPGVKQIVTVSVEHPEALRWGFQLIARTTANQTKQAGTFTSDAVVRIRCETGNEPCNGGIEFAEHSNAPRTAAGEGFTFNVTWTPPATDVGNVIFYAAGNAANGDGGLTGDRIYTTLKTVSPNRPCTLTQKPVISSVQNAGSFASSIGPGALISIFGSGFQLAAQPAFVSGGDFVDNGFPRQLSCAALEIDGKRVPITYASGTQINAQAPFGIAAGPVTARIILNPDLTNQVMSDPVTVSVQTLSPGFFSFGSGSVAATVVNSATPVADPAVIPGSVFAKPGDVVTLWATGLGTTSPAIAEGAVAGGIAPVAGTVVLTVGGIAVPTADILYAGLSPSSISGLNQINVKLPAGLPDGKAAVTLEVNGAKAQTGLTIPIKK